ncbi:MAG TPA: hypothetical protein VGB17_00770 [Pyrinomonadaceae bacterium]|jgi:signal transduction histidine kinase
MKPLKSEFQDTETLQKLGRASVQIVHDLKNQLNGLKLYATFLRKRMEKNAAPADEQETIAKLIAGLERASADMTTLVRLGRPPELRRLPGIDLQKILASVAETFETEGQIKIEPASGPLLGEFDALALAEALKTVTAGALALRRNASRAEPLEIRLRVEAGPETPRAVIEWPVTGSKGESDHFNSFAGSEGLRLALAARIFEAHGGSAGQTDDALEVRLPVTEHQA